MLWLRNPRVEIVIASAIHCAPRSPSAMRMRSEAGVVVASSPAGPSTRKTREIHCKIKRHNASDANNNPRDKSRRASRISAATNVAVCHPPYAKAIGTIAAPILLKRSNENWLFQATTSIASGCMATNSKSNDYQRRDCTNF